MKSTGLYLLDTLCSRVLFYFLRLVMGEMKLTKEQSKYLSDYMKSVKIYEGYPVAKFAQTFIGRGLLFRLEVIKLAKVVDTELRKIFKFHE